MKLLTTTALLAAMTAWSGGANAACDRMEKVSAVWLPIMQTTAYYVAREEKLFETAWIAIVFNATELDTS
jgi:NitT/TauT family transport system substrate-binding protein